MRLLIRLPVIFFCTLTITQVVGQTEESVYWLRWYEQWQFRERLTLHAELDNRRVIDPDQQVQFISHFHLHYQFSKKHDLSQGFSYSNVVNSEGNGVPELRLFNELTGNYPLFSRLDGQLRFRLEERFIRKINEEGELLNEYQFYLRYRQRAQLKITMTKKIHLRVGDELMFQTQPDGAIELNQNRLYSSLEMLWKKNFSTEVGYIRMVVGNRGNFTSYNVLRLTFRHFILRSN